MPQQAKARPLIVSDFDGAVTSKDSIVVVLGRIDEPLSKLQEMLLKQRKANFDTLKRAGLISYLGIAGLNARNGRALSILRSGSADGRIFLPVKEIPARLCPNLELYSEDHSIPASTLLPAMLPTDAEIERICSQGDWEKAYASIYARFAKGQISELAFHSRMNWITNKFVRRAHVEAAIREINDKHIRPGASGLFAAAKEANATLIFCSFSFLKMIHSVVETVSRKFASPQKAIIVSNSVKFESRRPDSPIKSLTRIGNKWRALDHVLHRLGIVKGADGKYPNSVVYDDSAYNLSEMASRFATSILLVSSNHAQSQIGELIQGFPGLRVFAENGVFGINNALRDIIVSCIGSNSGKWLPNAGIPVPAPRAAQNKPATPASS